jgi:hypothetical protein
MARQIATMQDKTGHSSRVAFWWISRHEGREGLVSRRKLMLHKPEKSGLF